MAFPTAPHPKMSDRYVMVDTNQVIANMADLGYQVAEIRGPKHRTTSGTYGYHMVDFRLPSAVRGKAEHSPRVLFMNSYDGSRRAQVVAGLIRWVCSNGVIAGDIIAAEKVTHVGDEARDLITRVSKIAAESEKVLERIGAFKAKTLSRAQQEAFTLQAVGLVFENPDPVAARLFNMPRRAEDTAPDLWTTFNRVQENLIRGGLPMVNANGVQTITRPVINVHRDFTINRSLWDTLEAFAEEQAA